ncbi:hypothetical protein M9Y10_003110 [Tritrichomonas musculus]|uniref:Surface antigen BspA-like n=1 Tax=Tritrichomonas musculus TaxID=1915356 RepID=A0ABR2JNN0_9EUKA
MKNKDTLSRLLSNKYSQFIDFHFVDKSFADSIYNNQSKLIKEFIALKIQQEEVISKLKKEQEIELKNLREEINQFKEDKSLFVTNEQRESDLESLRKEMNEFKENLSLFVTKEQYDSEVKQLRDEIKELKEEKSKLQKLQKTKLDRLKKIVFEASKCTGQNDNLEVFNCLCGEAQNFIFSGLTNGKDCSQINWNIGSLLLFLSNETQKSKSDKEMKDKYVYICSKQKNESLSKLTEIESIEIKSNIVSVLYENGSLESDEFIDVVNKFEDIISIEYQYPLLGKDVFESIKKIKQTKCQKLKISFLVSGIEKTTKDFQREEVINKITFDTSVKIISGGLNEGSFEYCTNVTELIIPNSVTLIGGGAFNALQNLRELTIPPSVETIEGGAFSECFLLNEVTFPPQLKEVHCNAFKRCRNLKRIVIDPYNTKIQPNAFSECTSLKYFTIHPSIKELKKLDLNNTSLYDIRELVIPETVTSIANDAFSTCTNLYKVTILPSMKSVGNIGANHLQCIRINPYETNIDSLIVPSLNHFEFHPSVTHIEHIEHPLFKNVKKITIPSTVTSIAPGAFYDYSLLEEIDIPNSIETIKHDTFKNCKNLKKVAIAPSVKKIHGGVFCQCSSLEEIIIPDSVEFIGGGAFSYCSSLKKVTLPDSLKSIENDQFIHCCNLYQVNLPGTLISIGRNAFDVCQRLENITIPKSLTTIGYKAFVGMSIRTIIIPNSVDCIGEQAFCGCQNLTEVKFAEYSKLIRIGKEAFYHCHLLKSIKIPDRVKFIGEGAFRNCSNLDNVILPLRLVTIENDVFNQCTSLKNINIKDCTNIISIGGGAFNGCALTEIEIPYQVKSIGGGAFYCCENLQNINFPYDLDSIDEYAFKGAFENCESLTQCRICPKIKQIEQYTFKNNTNLTELILDSSLSSICEDAFYGCPVSMQLNNSL